jgi:hypothetical protein
MSNLFSDWFLEMPLWLQIYFMIGFVLNKMGGYLIVILLTTMVDKDYHIHFRNKYFYGDIPKEGQEKDNE